MPRYFKHLFHRPFHKHGEISNRKTQTKQAKDDEKDITDTQSSTYSQPAPQPDRSTQIFQPQDLWEAAYNQLDERQRHILSTIQIPSDSDKGTDPRGIIGEVIEITKEQYEKYRQTGDGRTRRSSQKIINAALSYKDIISAVAALDPTQHAASAWTIVSLGLTMTKNHQGSRNALFESSEYLADVLTQSAFMEKRFYRDGHPNIRDNVSSTLLRLYMAILQYAAQIRKAQDPSMGRKMLDCLTDITDHPLTELKSSVEQARKELGTWVQLGGYLHCEQEARNLLDAIDELAKSMDSLAKEFSLEKLRVAEGALYDTYIDQHEDFCLPNTRTDILNQVSKWAMSDHEFIFWLNGMAGTGKSTIARTAARDFDKHGLLGATFFFKRGEADRSNAKYLMPTIARQLVNKYQQLAPDVLDAIRKDPFLATKPLDKQFDKLLYQPISNLGPDRSTVIVILIDALDECDGEEGMKAVLRLLSKLGDIQSVRLRIFLTSRPELPIRLGFKKEKSHCDLALHELPAPVIEQDIRLFLKHKLSAIRDERDEKLLPLDWPENENIEKLVEMTKPLFIFATTICRFVSEKKFLPHERLKRILEDKTAISGDRMDRTYLPVLNQLLSDTDESEAKQLKQEFQDIVGVIILLAAPLSMNALASLIKLPSNIVGNRLDGFHSVLRVPENAHLPVRILHLSFRDYLLTTRSSFHVDGHETHAKIAAHCLRVMGNQLKENVCDLASYGTQRKNIDAEVIDQHLPADVQYSCHYWVHHLQQSQGRISDTEILSFLKKHFTHWLEALALMGRIFEGVEMINILQSRTWGSIGDELSGFLYDARRFTLQSLYMAGIAPLQLYYAGLAFAPEKSVMRQCFYNKTSKRVQVLQVDKTWSPNLQTLEGHSHWVWSVAFSPDGRTLASGSDDGAIKLWDTATGTEQQTLTGHSDSVWSVAFSPDGRTLASGSDDKTIKLWDTATGTEQQTLTGHSDSVWSVAFSPDGRTLASGSHDKTIKLWDTATGTEQQTLTGHSSSVFSVTFSPNGRTLASGSADKTIKIWDTATGTEQQTLTGHSDFVWSVAFSPDGRTLASGSHDGAIKVWDTTTGTEQQQFVQNEDISNFSISLSACWVSLEGKELLWLPANYRAFVCHAIKDGILTLGYSDGRVTMIRFHTQ
ncbi:vegetative incompatibility protein HET-E-1 [Aspergillus awamori]|uniref:Vegetative incompatibility protein HET-E-1 n=1 Tax=Aspergillus awamori TaxID=105351 RepID=A0A401KRG9_ASPAW|nr:vegetative incompatibility protein HET-E-1 [Aspergillus awamori]